MFVSGFLCLALAVSQATSSPASQTQQPASSAHPTLNRAEIAKLRAQAQAGDPDAQFRLGKAYESGDGVPQDDTQAAAWYRKAAEQGNPAAANSLGLMYRSGQGVRKNKEEAVQWYRKAAKLGSPEGMFNVGASYYNDDELADHFVLAYAWFLLAQEAGSPAAQDAVRRSEGELGDFSRGDAFVQIGEMYEKGEDLPQSYENAAHWYRRGADISQVAATRLATFLINGVGGVRPDYGEAMRLCKSPAEKGYDPAEYCVGYLYQHGLGVAPDAKKAAKWYAEAAWHGSGKAALTLADMHLNGEGVPIDRPQAYWLLFLAYRNGVAEARSQARALRPEMNAEETKSLDKKLRQYNLDPEKVYAIIDDPAPPDPARARQLLTLRH